MAALVQVALAAAESASARMRVALQPFSIGRFRTVIASNQHESVTCETGLIQSLEERADMGIGFDHKVAVSSRIGLPAKALERDHGLVWRGVRHVQEEAVILFRNGGKVFQPPLGMLSEFSQNHLVVEARSDFKFAIFA